MKTKFALLGLVATLALMAAGCVTNDVPPPILGHEDPYDIHHIYFSSEDLQNATVVRPAESWHDAYGILHVTTQITSKVDQTLQIDASIQFYAAGGHAKEHLGPRTFALKPNIPVDIDFNSTQPADEFRLEFSPAQ